MIDTDGNDAISATERAYRTAEATDGFAAWTAVSLAWPQVVHYRLCLARIGGDPPRDLPRHELEARINRAIDELRDAFDAVGPEHAIEAWASTVPETAAAVMEQAYYLGTLEERDAA